MFVSFYHHMIGEDHAFGVSESKPWSEFFNYLLHSKSGNPSSLTSAAGLIMGDNHS